MVVKRIRSGGFAGFAELALEVGLDPLQLADLAGLPREALVNPDLRVPVAAVERLMMEAILRSGVDDFALRLGQLQTALDLGFLSALLRHQPDLRRLLNALMKYMAIHHEALAVSVVEVGDFAEVHLNYTNDIPHPFGRHRAEMATSALVRHIRGLTGDGWRPEWVSFRHARPASIETHKRIFQADCLFGQNFDGVGVTADALNLPLASGALPVLAEEASRHADLLLKPLSQGVTERVLNICLMHMPEGAASCTFVAKALGISVRSLQRRLAGEGATFAAIVNQARRQLAQSYIAVSGLPLADVAGLLGFSSQSAFNHWYRQLHGERPSDARRRLSAGGGDLA